MANGILIMPESPDFQPTQMMMRAFNSSNGTFVHDDISKNVSECPTTNQIRLSLQDWTLEAYTFHGEAKSVGGDDYFVYYVDPEFEKATFIARSTDLGNGTYSLNFTNSPFVNMTWASFADQGTLHVWLEYTCGAGRILRPFKDAWNTNGAVNVHWEARNVPRPPSTEFVPPNQDGDIDLGSTRFVLAVGDSVMQQFVSYDFKARKFYRPNLTFGKNVGDPLLSRTWNRQLQLITMRLRRVFKNHNSAALILGVAAWELQKPYGNGDAPIPDQPYADNDLFDDHLKAVRRLLTSLQRRFPLLKIFWKSGAYLHLHVAARDRGDDWVTISRLEYECQYRTEMLYHMQNELMAELDIPVMHLLEASYLMPDRHRSHADTMHYSIEANDLMINWFYPQGMNTTIFDKA
jgi:hypothetical protein